MNLSILGSGSSGNSYLLSNAEEALVIDAGVSFSKIAEAADYDISKIKCLLYSHQHLDHSKYIKDYNKNYIPVYGPKHPNPDLKINEVTPKVKFTIGGFSIMAIPLVHDVENFGYIISHLDMGTCIYITDTQHIPYKIPGLNQLIIEANFDNEILDNHVLNGHLLPIVRKRVLQSHLSIDGCREFLKLNDLTKVNNIVLIHLSDGNSDSRKFQKEVQEMTGKNVFIAKKGLKINFDKVPF